MAIANKDALTLVDLRGRRPMATLQQGNNTARTEPLLNLRDGYNRGYTAPMKTAISIPDAVFEDAERLAKRRGWSRSELYANAVAEYVKSERFVGVRERLDSVYGEHPADSELDPAIEQVQTRLLSKEKW